MHWHGACSSGKSSAGGHDSKVRCYVFREVLPYLGIDCKISGIASTELVYLEVKGLIEDFTYIVSDGSWIHLEFESDKVTERICATFSGYEAVTGYTYQVRLPRFDLLSKGGGGTERGCTKESIHTVL